MKTRRTWGVEEFFDACCRSNRLWFFRHSGRKDGLWRGYLMFLLTLRRFDAKTVAELAQKVREQQEREERGY